MTPSKASERSLMGSDPRDLLVAQLFNGIIHYSDKINKSEDTKWTEMQRNGQFPPQKCRSCERKQ
jgi:hypothetical protein